MSQAGHPFVIVKPPNAQATEWEHVRVRPVVGADIRRPKAAIAKLVSHLLPVVPHIIGNAPELNSAPRGRHPAAEWVRAKGSESWAGRYASSPAAGLRSPARDKFRRKGFRPGSYRPP